MKLFLSVFGIIASVTVNHKETKAYSSSAFGVWFVNCDHFFRPNASWPLQDHYPLGDTVRVSEHPNTYKKLNF